jgi:hypothetical protein
MVALQSLKSGFADSSTTITHGSQALFQDQISTGMSARYFLPYNLLCLQGNPKTRILIE